MSDDKLQRLGVAVRWGLGLLCLTLEVVIVGIVLAALKRQLDSSELLFWHPTLMTIGVILFLSHGMSNQPESINNSPSHCHAAQARTLHGPHATLCEVFHGRFHHHRPLQGRQSIFIPTLQRTLIIKPQLASFSPHPPTGPLLARLHSRLGLGVLFFFSSFKASFGSQAVLPLHEQQGFAVPSQLEGSDPPLLILPPALPEVARVHGHADLRERCDGLSLRSGRHSPRILGAIFTKRQLFTRTAAHTGEQSTVIAAYVLTFVLTLLELFIDFAAKGGELIPQEPEEEPEEEPNYVRLNDAIHLPQSF